MEEQSINILRHRVGVIQAELMERLNEVSKEFGHRVSFTGNFFPVTMDIVGEQRLLGYEVKIEVTVKL